MQNYLTRTQISFFIENYEDFVCDADMAGTVLAETVDKKGAGDLSEMEIEAIELFINFFKLIGLPKSVGEIYGLLFVSPRPLAMDDLMQRLRISLGAASQGLRLLRSFGAVKTIYVPGDRRDHYVADLDLSNFATVFIKEELLPRMNRSLERIRRMEELALDMNDEDRQSTNKRIERLKHWLERGNKMLPWILKFLVS